MPCAKCGLDAMRVTGLDRPTRGTHAGAAHTTVCSMAVMAQILHYATCSEPVEVWLYEKVWVFILKVSALEALIWFGAMPV